TNYQSLLRLARIGQINPLMGADPSSYKGAQVVVDNDTFIIPLEGVIDIAAEKSRLEKALAASQKERDSIAKRLENPAFVEKAKPEAVEKARADHAAHAAEAERLVAALRRLG
ncbi:MAG TPA: valine--tRNA ligase, partial [Novosphingobium sp.]|nr:valine--tRNA ligase [Novosphingobium sp.]